ncbi:MAG: GTP-binding protein, partial [Pseudonocardia sp.]
IAARLSPHAISFVDGPGGTTPLEALAEYDGAAIVPILAGSARTGAGVPELTAAISTWFPRATDREGDPAGVVFKIERDGRGKEVFLRVRDGRIRVRQRVSLSGRTDERITAIRVSAPKEFEQADTASAGQIAIVRGLESARVGDTFGAASATDVRSFPAPVLETIVEPVDPAQRGAMFAALSELAEQDPLIALHTGETTQEVAVRLYGEVQKQVIGALLAEEYGVEVTFAQTNVVCIERLVGTGASAEHIRTGDNPYLATIGLRVQPSPAGAGVAFSLDVEAGSMPPAFFRATEEGIRDTLRQGLHGWAIPDCSVTMTASGYCARQSHAHQKFNKAFSSVAADFRRLGPVVLTAALHQARTRVCEPVDRFTLEVPTDSVDAVVSAVSRVGGVPLSMEYAAAYCRIVGHIPAATVHKLTSRLPDISGGTGAITSELDHYRPVRGDPPERPRIGPDPSDREVWFREMPR